MSLHPLDDGRPPSDPVLLRIQQEGPIVHLQLDRPAKRNSISDELLAQLHRAFLRLPKDARVAVISGAGDHFCAGLDLSEVAERSVTEGLAHSRAWHACFDAIQFAAVPVIAVLHGAVVGGGLELASAAHLRVAEASAFYALPEGTRGIFVGGGGSVRISRLVGVSRMTDMMLTGRVFNADEGQSIGLSNYRVDDGQGLARAFELARKIAGNAPLSNYAITQALPRIADLSHQDGLFMEALMSSIAQGDDAAKERVRAFLDKRADKVETLMSRGLFQAFDDVFILDGVRTPMVDYQGAFADANPIDLGIKAARAALARADVDAAQVDSVLAGNMAPGGFDQFYVPRHIGLYAGVPQDIPALMVQRICGTGFELFRQAGEQIATGAATLALVVGTESMTRNPIAAFDHRGGFRLGAPVGFKDFMWEALTDPSAAISMIQTAENLARQYGIGRAEVDAFAATSFARAVAAQESGWLAGEIVPVANEVFELAGYQPRRLRLAGKATIADRDTHPRPTPVEVLAKLRTVFADGVQTGGNSSALTDAAAAALVANGAVARAWRKARGKPPLARVAAAAVVGVPPEIMGIGPAPAIRLLLERSGRRLDEIARFEINEAQGAQTLAVARELSLDLERVNVKGGAIALGHPLAATGVRLTLTVARQLKEIGARWGIASACVGGGQGIALLIENTET